MEYYSSEQVKRLLERISSRIPKNDPKLTGLRKYIEENKKNIEKFITR